MERERNRLDSTTKSDSDDDNATAATASSSKPRQIPIVKIFTPHHECSSRSNSICNGEKQAEHLFKKLLVACCDSCERRASLIPGSSNDELDTEDENHTECDESEHDGDADEDEAENAFECMEENKAEMHDVSFFGHSFEVTSKGTYEKVVKS
uniref:Uncharacterized protein n=1 Tax=Panagrolaimus davidi TaxID=227884 RepID=A0A914QTF5_9BILA